MMLRKEDIHFSADGGIELSAWLFVPLDEDGPLPAIGMAHGWAGTKYHGLEPATELDNLRGSARQLYGLLHP